MLNATTAEQNEQLPVTNMSGSLINQVHVVLTDTSTKSASVAMRNAMKTK